MSFKIDVDQCAACGVCEGSCGQSAIGLDGDKYKINELKCTSCGACSDACPMSCISGTRK